MPILFLKVMYRVAARHSSSRWRLTRSSPPALGGDANIFIMNVSNVHIWVGEGGEGGKLMTSVEDPGSGIRDPVPF